jgi:hypothetical protein
MTGPVRKKPTETDDQAKPEASKDQTREALEFCFEDVSSLRMLGARPLSDLSSRPAPAAASSAGPAAPRGGAQRWNLVVLALLVLTLAATTAATLLGR